MLEGILAEKLDYAWQNLLKGVENQSPLNFCPMHIGSRMKDLAKLCDLSPTLQSFFAFLSLSLSFYGQIIYFYASEKERKKEQNSTNLYIY